MKAEAQPTNGATRESGLATANGCCLRRFVRGHNHVTLYLGDCLDVSIEADAIITDPPYGMKWPSDNKSFSGGKTRRGNGSVHPRIVGDDKPFDPAPWLERKLPTVMWGANHFWNRLPPGAALIWQKRNEHALGTFLSDAEIAYMNVGHGVYICKKTFAGTSKSIEGGTGYNQPSLHPNQKPVMLMAWAMERAKVPKGATVCDPYMGSGTTAVACLRTGRNFVGVEIDQTHFKTACARLERECNQGALL